MLSRKRILFAILGLITAIIGWYGFLYWRSRPPKPNVSVAVFGSQQTLNTFLSASDVTAERLHYGRESRQNSWKLKGYNHDAPVSVSGENAAALRQILAREPSYAWDIAKMCAPDYGVLFTFRTEQETVRVALCFDCNLIGIFNSTDDSVMRINREEDFDPARHALIPVIKSLFPHDAAIQGLK